MERTEREEFKELVVYTLTGYIGGIGLGYLLDTLNLQKNPIGEWIVRTISGESESIFEGIFAIKKRFLEGASSLAEIYGWGKFVGMVFPWFVDWGSRILGIDMYSWESFYVPYFYSMSDQIGATIAMFVFFLREQRNIVRAAIKYLRHPVSAASLAIVLIVPIGLLSIRLLGFSPTRQVFVALETAAANLCWVPSLVGAFFVKEEENG